MFVLVATDSCSLCFWLHFGEFLRTPPRKQLLEALPGRRKPLQFAFCAYFPGLSPRGEENPYNLPSVHIFLDSSFVKGSSIQHNNDHGFWKIADLCSLFPVAQEVCSVTCPVVTCPVVTCPVVAVARAIDTGSCPTRHSTHTRKSWTPLFDLCSSELSIKCLRDFCRKTKT